MNPTLSPSYYQEVANWLDAPKGLMHCWSPNAALLDEAVTWWLAQAEKRPAETLPLFFAEGDFFPLLQKLNELLAAAQRGESEAQAHAGQFWLVRHAEQLSAEHIDILRRICLHYPELGIHLALFSQTEEVPAAAEGVRLMGLMADVVDVPLTATTHAPDAERQDHRSTGARTWLGVGALSALLLAGYWLASRPQPSSPPAAATDLAVAESSSPASTASAAASAVPPTAAASDPKVPASAASITAPTAKPNNAPAKAVVGTVSLSRRWLLSLPAECSVVVHKQSTSLQEAEVFKASSSMLVNARILLTAQQDGKPARYLVVTGPFRSADRVHNYMQRLDWKASASSITREELLRQIPN